MGGGGGGNSFKVNCHFIFLLLSKEAVIFFVVLWSFRLTTLLCHHRIDLSAAESVKKKGENCYI